MQWLPWFTVAWLASNSVSVCCMAAVQLTSDRPNLDLT